MLFLDFLEDFLGASETEPAGELPVEPSLLLNTGSTKNIYVNENVNKVRNNNKGALFFTKYIKDTYAMYISSLNSRKMQLNVASSKRTTFRSQQK